MRSDNVNALKKLTKAQLIEKIVSMEKRLLELKLASSNHHVVNGAVFRQTLHRG